MIDFLGLLNEQRLKLSKQVTNLTRANPFIPDVTPESIGVFKLNRISWGVGKGVNLIV